VDALGEAGPVVTGLLPKSSSGSNEPRHEAENKLPNGSDARGRERMTAPIL
jgi:hypothetical protein